MLNSIIQGFVQLVKEIPDKTAVVQEDLNISFSTLLHRSLMVAHKINGYLNLVNQPIAVYLPKNIDTVISDIGISFSGNAYMNLDVKSPIQRIQRIVEKINPRLIITNKSYYGELTQFGSTELPIVIIEDIIESNNVVYDVDTILSKLDTIIDTDPYCIINTSGSTGTPKGVVLNHRGFIDFYEWAISKFEFDTDTIIGSLSPSFFDIYSFELCLMILKGSTIQIIPDQYSPFPAKIIDYLVKAKVTFIFWVPTIMVNISNMDILSKFDLRRLKLVWFAGEVFPTKHLNYWMKHIPKARFVNMYGPIEISLDCVYFIVDKPLEDNEPLPIGVPCRNTDILILTDGDLHAEKVQVGELCVRGSSLALGYYNDLEKTAAAFVQNPLNCHYPELIYRTGDLVYMADDGNIMFLGRKDYQIKHQGYRIELGEIENAVLALDYIANACVVYNASNKEIVLFYQTNSVFDVKKIRQDLATTLPKYMLPSKFVYMDKIPMNANGKIDRQALLSLIEGS